MAYEQKTKPEAQDALAYIQSLEPVARRTDALRLLAMFGEETGQPAQLWTGGIIGFGSYGYTYASGHQGVAARSAFAPRKGKISLYLLMDDPRLTDLLPRLGKHSHGVSCIYINKLADVEEDVLRALIRASWQAMAELYPAASGGNQSPAGSARPQSPK